MLRAKYSSLPSALFLALTFLSAGCASQKSEKSLFLERNSTDQGKYTILWEGFPELWQFFVQQERGVTLGAIRGTRRSLPTDCRTNTAFDKLISNSAEMFDAELALIKSIQTNIMTPTDRFFYYRLKIATNIEEGWLISNRGVLKKKFPTGSVTLLIDPNQ
jgi:hypothetical protein